MNVHEHFDFSTMRLQIVQEYNSNEYRLSIYSFECTRTIEIYDFWSNKIKEKTECYLRYFIQVDRMALGQKLRSLSKSSEDLKIIQDQFNRLKVTAVASTLKITLAGGPFNGDVIELKKYAPSINLVAPIPIPDIVSEYSVVPFVASPLCRYDQSSLNPTIYNYVS